MKKKFIILGLLISCLLPACNNQSNQNSSSIGESSINSDLSNDDSKSITESSSTSDSTTSSHSDSSSSSESTLPDIEVDSRWNVDFSLRGMSFRNKLKTLIDAKVTNHTSYSGCLSLGAKAAAYPNPNSNTFVPFYHSTKKTTTTGSCNREHTWPNSRGGSCCESDPFMVRPTLTADNSSRGNNFYGLGSSEFDPASIENYDAARGESARVILYVATKYYSSGLSLSNNPNDSTGLKTMGTLKYLIRWNKAYAPTVIEKQINDYLDKNGYGRNPFVDHPEYADYIWNENGFVDTTSGGGTDTGTKYNLVDALEDIDGASLAIVSSASTSSYDPWYGMTSSAKRNDLPWYIVGTEVMPSSDFKTMNSDSNSLAFFKFKKESNGMYSIYNESIKKYLVNYVDGTHYSIRFESNATSTYSIYWNITSSGKGFTFYGDNEVYLEYYNGSFTGYKNQPSVPIYLYK